MKKKHILILFSVILILVSSCKKEDTQLANELGANQFETYLSLLIMRRDTLEFSLIVADAPDEKALENIMAMTLISDLAPRQIIDSIKSLGVIYRRIFSTDEFSVASYLPSDGGYYDVSTTYRSFNGTHVAQIRYANSETPEVNLIEFIAIYQDGVWKLLTINFLDVTI
jgi:hypothetical protein